jgi:hypothetical protein
MRNKMSNTGYKNATDFQEIDLLVYDWYVCNCAHW